MGAIFRFDNISIKRHAFAEEWYSSSDGATKQPTIATFYNWLYQQNQAKVFDHTDQGFTINCTNSTYTYLGADDSKMMKNIEYSQGRILIFLSFEIINMSYYNYFSNSHSYC